MQYALSGSEGLVTIRDSIRAELSVQRTLVVGVIAVQTETSMGVKLPAPRMTPQEVVSDALDAVQAGTNQEIFAGAQTRSTYQAFSADPTTFQTKMSSRLPQPQAQSRQAILKTVG